MICAFDASHHIQKFSGYWCHTEEILPVYSNVEVDCPRVGPGPCRPRADPARPPKGQGWARNWWTWPQLAGAGARLSWKRTSSLDWGQPGPALPKLGFLLTT
ncbi:hypothetical protein JOM56_002883 [Amanita muscaria]